MSFFGELRRRNVFRVGIGYLAAAWLGLQVADVVLPNLGTPTWVMTAVILSCVVGFPVALTLAWFYEWTAEGIKPESELTTTREHGLRGRRIDFVIIGILVLAVGFLVANNYLSDDPGAEERSVAVLPFVNRSAAEEDAGFFSLGMHDALIAQLSKVGDLKVIARPSVMDYRNTDKDYREIGQELGVATVLTGSVLRAGDEIQINAQLIDARTEAHIWSDSYPGELTAQSIFAIQNELATAIAQALHATLSPGEAARLDASPTQSRLALDYYFSGLEYDERGGEENGELAQRQFENAVDADEDFALAWAALADQHLGRYSIEERTESRLAQAEVALNRALVLDPNLPEAHLVLGRLHAIEGNLGEAFEQFDIVERLVPGNADVYRRRGHAILDSGNDVRTLERALDQFLEALERDPRDRNTLGTVARTYLILREYAQADEWFDRTLVLYPDWRRAIWGQPHIPMLRDGDVAPIRAAYEARPGSVPLEFAWLAAVYARDYDAAIQVLDSVPDDEKSSRLYGITRTLDDQPDLAVPYFQAARTELEQALTNETDIDGPWRRAELAAVRAYLGDRPDALALINETLALLPDYPENYNVHVIHLEVIWALIASEEYERAIEELDEYLESPGWWSVEGMLPDPRLDPIREHPEFQALVRRHGRP